jgi:outer membrane protein
VLSDEPVPPPPAGDATQLVADQEHHVSRDLQVARPAAASAFQRLDLTRQWLAHASDALDLAQARYNSGVSPIIELTQAQLSKTRAAIEQTTARYEYQARAAALRYQVGSPP